MNPSPDASLEDLSKPRDLMRTAVKATNTDGDDEEAEGDASAKKDGKMPLLLLKSDRERLSIPCARPEDVRLNLTRTSSSKTSIPHLRTAVGIVSKYKDVVRGEG